MSDYIPQDAAARARAIDPFGSFIVQAPAGSGKTELLIQRYLALLGGVGRPEEILAITFTRKAAAEMKERVIRALEAARGAAPEAAHQRLTWGLARKALQRNEMLEWNIFEDPSAVQIQTIDSFCALLTASTPLLSRFGGRPQVTADPNPLYARAAERSLEMLESGSAAAEAVAVLVRHLDNRVEVLRDLLVSMLGQRDQWLRHVIGGGLEQRQGLEAALGAVVSSRLERAWCRLSEAERGQWARCAAGAGENLLRSGSSSAAVVWAAGGDFPAPVPQELEHWRGLAALFLTREGEVKKRLDKTGGFPADGDKALRAAGQDILARLGADAELAIALKAIGELPGGRYDDGQWEVLEALCLLLPLAVAELWCVFQEEGTVDFVQVAQGAVEALGAADEPSDLLLRIDGRIGHILVDEFQDTSYLQYRLLELLTAGWQKGDGRSLFLVGDPMQSIYRFREAEVGLFLRARAEGIGALELEPLRLSVNFRSQAGVVEWVNETFHSALPDREDPTCGAIPYSPSQAARPAGEAQAVHVHALLERSDITEAQMAVDLVKLALAAGDESVAVLVRSRSHLRHIVEAFRQEGLRFQAHDIDVLAERPYIRDLLALTRALLHLGDKVAWLSVLRAPFCGLTLADLQLLCQDGRDRTVVEMLLDEKSHPELSPDGAERVKAIAPVLQIAAARRGSDALARLVEATWVSLGGPCGLGPGEIQDVRTALRLIDTLDGNGGLNGVAGLEEHLGKLYAAADPLADGRLQVMTIHKAKGLEFDTVILPGLGKKPRRGDRGLLRWIELGNGELLLAPIPPADGGEGDPTYELVGKFEKEMDDLESLRLLYVATTRARRQLHLLAHATMSKGEIVPEGDSLLSRLWLQLKAQFGTPVEGLGASSGAVSITPWGRLAQAGARTVLQVAEAQQRPSLNTDEEAA